ncbi:MAG: hypothetical protein AB1665_07570 [Candidatus Thermoplasmatota archaeon]
MGLEPSVLSMHCINRVKEHCRLDGAPCRMCSQWRCGRNDIVADVCKRMRDAAAVLSSDDSRKVMRRLADAAVKRGVVEYYELMLSTEELALTFFSKEAEVRLMSAPASQQTNLTGY